MNIESNFFNTDTNIISKIEIDLYEISLYSAQLITSKIYYFYSIYSWIQIIIGVLPTGGMFYFLRSFLTENEPEKNPKFISGASETANINKHRRQSNWSVVVAFFEANSVIMMDGLAVLGGLGACHQQAKKGIYPLPQRAFFWDGDITVHTCTTKTTQNNNKNKLNISTKTKLKKQNHQMIQNKKRTATITTILMTTNYQTTNQPDKTALQIIKKNNVISTEIKNEKNNPEWKNKKEKQNA